MSPQRFWFHTLAALSVVVCVAFLFASPISTVAKIILTACVGFVYVTTVMQEIRDPIE